LLQGLVGDERFELPTPAV